MAIDPQSFKDVLAQFASGITVVTATHQGAPHGLTVSSFTSLSLTPPLVLVCIGNQQGMAQIIGDTSTFGVNILNGNQQTIGQNFADKSLTMFDRFSHGSWKTGPLGNPILVDSLAWLECRVYRRHNEGDHALIIGEVQSSQTIGQARPLIYHFRDWHVLP